MAAPLPKGTRYLVGAFGGSGVVHMVAPQVFERIVPKWMPQPKATVYVSGLAELACAAGLLTRRRWAGPASVAVLVGVWPANVQMAVDETRAGRPWWRQAAVWARVPMQLPLMRWALRSPH